MQKFGIDISKWQGDFDIQKAKNNGVEFAILKIGGGDSVCYKDSQFENNYTKCENADMPKGCYFFGQALTKQKAVEEANYWLSLMKNHKFEYPVFYDVEAKMLSLDKRTLTDNIKTVCEIIESNGYWVGIYSSASHFNSNVYDNELARYSHWVASWGTTKPVLLKGGATQMWQFGGETNKLRSNKINGQVVDQDYCFVDYPTLIKKNGLNGYKNITTPSKTIEELAIEVIDGKWGNGVARKEALTKEGYDYNAVQTLVNQILKAK